ncbi:MAG: hypothetical protein ISQ14_13155 [Verrucomicrobiae bacterium]|jgi:hypothetical protein|nr:hypothetical protein [Verrucomicrobiae bacterium]
MNLFSMDNDGERERRSEATRHIKAWVESSLQLPEGVVAHVAELRCHEPDCPDFETVITLMCTDSSQNRSVKLPKALTDVIEADISSANFSLSQDCQH